MTQARLPLPTVVAALGGVLPNASETLLLRACLLPGESGVAAWAAWSRAAGDLKSAVADDRDGIKRLAPLLYNNLRANGAAIDATVLPYLRTIYAREQIRTRTYLRICEEVLSVLDDADVRVIMLRGAAAAITAYDDPALRHCHDISLLVAPSDISRAVAALCKHGLAVAEDGAASSADDVVLKHESTLPVELHTRLFEVSLYNLPFAEVRERTCDVQIGSRRVKVLPPTDALLHLVGHASYSRSRGTMRWLCDAWHILRRTPDLDWDLLIDTAENSHVVLPLAVTLAYMTDELRAPVPTGTMRRLFDAAENTGAFERDIALRGSRISTLESGWEAVRRVPGGLLMQARVLTWLAFPSIRFVRESSGANGRAGAYMDYLLRLSRLARAGVKSVVK